MGVSKYDRGLFLIITRVENILKSNNKRFRFTKVGDRNREENIPFFFFNEREIRKEKRERTKQANKQASTVMPKNESKFILLTEN